MKSLIFNLIHDEEGQDLIEYALVAAIIALGATPGAHEGRDGLAWAGWDDTGPARTPQDVPLPEDLPEAERRS